MPYKRKSLGQVRRAVRKAEKLLPGTPVEDGPDARWGAILGVSSFIETEPGEVWAFIRRWGTHAQEDLRTAIAVCLIEHLLEHHFESYFPLVEEMSMKSKRFADSFAPCWKFGQAERPTNARRFDQLKNQIRRPNKSGPKRQRTTGSRAASK